MRTPRGEDLMLLGHDPVAYFTLGKPVRGDPALSAQHDGATYYFISAEHRSAFLAAPEKYVPQYGGFCSDGAAYGLKTGSDPTEWEIFNGRLFIFGDVIGHEFWKLRPEWDVEHADEMWKESARVGRRWQTLKRLAVKVPWYKTNKEIVAEWTAKNPGKRIDYDPGGMLTNLFFKEPGWRAREGHMQPAVGLVGVDPCPPACPGVESQGFGDSRDR
jgi:YHS domain-containing protein